MNPDPAPLSVSELTHRMKVLLEETFAEVWVVGEIGNLTRARSGHVYLTLKDEDASLSAVIWKSTAGRLRTEIEEGMAVLVKGRISLYPPRGQYQLDIRLLEPRGLGALRAAFEALRRRLEAEGLFDPGRKRKIPWLPRSIGIVTSPTGAAIRDILKVIRRRFPRVSILLAPARVQGEGAAHEIAAAIRRLNERGGLDVLIVGRGGGSLEDLWAFNEEPVARAIHGSAIPVISAVGHEIDVTIADLVADLRAPTPSAAAEMVVPNEADVRATLAAVVSRLHRAASLSLERRRELVRALGGAYGLRRFPDRLREEAQGLDELWRRLYAAMAGRLRAAGESLARSSGRLESLSPLKVLGRGYSVTTREGDGMPLLDAGDVAEGEIILTRLNRGRVGSRIVEVKRDGD